MSKRSRLSYSMVNERDSLSMIPILLFRPTRLTSPAKEVEVAVEAVEVAVAEVAANP